MYIYKQDFLEFLFTDLQMSESTLKFDMTCHIYYACSATSCFPYPSPLQTCRWMACFLNRFCLSYSLFLCCLNISTLNHLDFLASLIFLSQMNPRHFLSQNELFIFAHLMNELKFLLHRAVCSICHSLCVPLFRFSSEDSEEASGYLYDSDASYDDGSLSSRPGGEMDLLGEILDSLSTHSSDTGGARLTAAKSLDFFRSVEDLDYKVMVC